MDEGVFCPEHGIDYDMECEKCHEVTRDFVLRTGLYMVQLKLLSSDRELESEPWRLNSFLFYLRNEKAVHEEEMSKASMDGDRDRELRESGFLQALDFVIDALLNE